MFLYRDGIIEAAWAHDVFFTPFFVLPRKNLILTNVTEERLIDPSDYRYRVENGSDETTSDDSFPVDKRIKVERKISQAMIPGSRLVKAEICQSS